MWKATFCLFSLALASVAPAQGEPTIDRDAETVYRIISTQTLSERGVVFRSVTPEMKAALWRAHLRHFLDSVRSNATVCGGDPVAGSLSRSPRRPGAASGS
jgi:hypothetical protein